MDTKKVPTSNELGAANGAVINHRADTKMISNFLLVWLDQNINKNDKECQDTLSHLHRIFTTVKLCTDPDQCIKVIERINDKKVCMIISGSFGQHVIPHIHDLTQIEAIFIFCGDKKRHEQWAKDWVKIEGVFTDISKICQALEQVVEISKPKTVAGRFITTDGNAIHKDLYPLFTYTQILKEILLTIEFQQQHIKEFADYCREQCVGNKHVESDMIQFEHQYRNHTPVQWYMQYYFLGPMINSALRTMDVSKIIKLGIFIAELHRDIERLHFKQFSADHLSETFTVYHIQVIHKEEFEQLRKKQDALMPFSVFLSTNKNRKAILASSERAQQNSDSFKVLFVMMIDPAQSTVPFANITDGSHDQESGEVLFSTHTVFRIHGIKPLDEKNRLFEVKLSLTKDTDEETEKLTKRIRDETLGSNGWDRLNQLLLKLGRFDDAERISNTRLKETKNNNEEGDIYEQLGLIKDKQKEYAEAVTFYEKALVVRQKTLPPNHPVLTSLYSNIGLMYSNMDKYSKALYYYEKAFAIQEKTLPSYHLDLVASYENIGQVYTNMANYLKALSYYQKALEIRQQTLPPSNPDLASTYHHIGSVYEKMGDYSKACTFYERAMSIGQQSLPPDDPQLKNWKESIENVKKKL